MHRKKLGYLEKKQDYKKRAIDHHYKAERLKKLKIKALERNPSEFHFHMINSRIVDGVHEEIVKPMEPKVRERIVKKEKLLKQYNQRVLQQRKSRRNPKGVPEDFDESQLQQRPRHIIFNR